MRPMRVAATVEVGLSSERMVRPLRELQQRAGLLSPCLLRTWMRTAADRRRRREYRERRHQAAVRFSATIGRPRWQKPLSRFSRVLGRKFSALGRRRANLNIIESALEAQMSRKAILLLACLYFLAAVAFGVFHVAADPFLSSPDAAVVGKAAGCALLLFGGAGLLPLSGWALYRFNLRYAMWPMLSWAFIAIALAYFYEIGVRLERNVQISTLTRNLALADAKLSCLDSQHANKFRSELGITEREVSVYCGCVSEATAASVTTDELTYIAASGKAPQPLQERAAELGRPCRNLLVGK
jgi:hypothetical protein